MKKRHARPGHPVLGFLARLRADARGNALAMMAAMLIPLAAFSGSAIDMGRLYAVRTRLQQACDAGALAGRKYMTGTTLDQNAITQSQTFFANNFNQGWFKTSTVSFTPSLTTDVPPQVKGVAKATVPMTIMTMFGVQPQAITVNCQARYDVADTDIVFVLDTTGSMACLPSDSDSTCNTYVNTELSNGGVLPYSRPADSALGAASGATGSSNDSTAGYPTSTGYYVTEKSGSRIAALRTAVINFFTTVASTADPTTHIRYGFVTYTSTVNAGKAIMEESPSYMIGGSGNSTTNWTYQSRAVTADYTYPNPVQNTYTKTSQTTCNTYIVARNPSVALTYSSSTSQATETKVSWSSANSGTCVVTKYTYGPQWTYQPVSYNVSSYLSSKSVDDPSKVNDTPSSWQGCVEEAYSDPPGGASFDITALPNDLNPDLIPTPSNWKTSWKPMWPDVEYGRNTNMQAANYDFTSTANVISNLEPADDNPGALFGYTSSGWDNSKTDIAKYYLKAGFITCGKPVRRLAVMTLQDVTNYVNASDFRAIGGTYHDTGMIWGTRLLSRNGIFAGDNSTWTGHQPPNRVIVFLTDGDMAPSPAIYGMYGLEYFDKRVTNGSYASQEDDHNARFLAECAKAKAMNVSVWTVSIAPTPAAGTTTPVQQCATTTAQALFTQSGSDLSDKFQTIAQQVAMLRVSK